MVDPTSAMRRTAADPRLLVATVVGLTVLAVAGGCGGENGTNGSNVCACFTPERECKTADQWEYRDCNECACSSGEWSCTSMGCLCDDVGETWTQYECDTCRCGEDGIATCTRGVCTD